jgi:NAD(P)H-dependent FMN reductase
MLAMSVRVLLVSGSLRSGSTNTAVLRTAHAHAPIGIATDFYDGLASLPQFNPDDDHDPLPPSVVRLRGALHHADAVLFSTPEYAGTLPGSFKNLLDWLIGDDDTRSIYEKPVAWINPSVHGATGAVATLRAVLGYAHATIVEAACAAIPVTSADVGEDGLVHGPDAQTRILAALQTLAGDAHLRSE